MLKALFNRLKGHDKTANLLPVEQDDPQDGQLLSAIDPEWSKTNTYQYLLNTATLSYESKMGPIQIELNDPAHAAKAIEQIIADQDSLAGRAQDPSGNVSPFTITVCAVILEELAGKRRIRAIPEAATLRLMDLKHTGVDVTYGHLRPDIVRDSRQSVDVIPFDGNRLYNNGMGLLHPDAFFARLEQVNNDSALLFEGHSVGACDFSHAITQRELDAIAQFEVR